jgi:hypothetical protein
MQVSIWSLGLILSPALKRIIPARWNLRTFNAPGDEFCLVHVGQHHIHYLRVGLSLNEASQGGFIFPHRERPKMLRQKLRAKRVANQAPSLRQLIHDAHRVQQEPRDSPAVLEREEGEQCHILPICQRTAEEPPGKCRHVENKPPLACYPTDAIAASVADPLTRTGSCPFYRA